jgi:hypothetical protein
MDNRRLTYRSNSEEYLESPYLILEVFPKAL